MPLRWKVCGVTRMEDALAAVELGADAIGFVFHHPSPRAVSPAEAARISAQLPRATWRFGVFVDRDPAEMNATVREASLDFIQLAGDEPPEIVPLLERHAFKTLRLDPEWDERHVQDHADRYPECTLLIDAVGGYGGTGRLADWEAAAQLARWHRLVLAGGLTPETVADAVRRVRPWAVDVASGVEAAPGVKDHDALRAFARALEPFR
jgi:phosphoribosylanthranilate isomerase